VNDRIAEVWLSRAAAEAAVHDYARHIVADLEATSADDAVLALARRMVADEERHARICVDVASRYAGRALTAPPMRPYLDPFATIPLPLRAALRVVSTCCIGESLACVWVDESTRATKPKWLQETLRKHLADEIHHARVGWAYLASMRDRSALGEWVPRLIAENLRAWRTFDPCWPSAGFPEHGLPSHADTMRWVEDAVRTLVVPGFAEVGIEVAS
jgi:hypothetical protein